MAHKAQLAVLILAAGHGTRMISKQQKVLHEVGGKPMVAHLFDAVRVVTELPPLFVVGQGQTGISELFGSAAAYVVQAEQLGTGHATMIGAPGLRSRSKQVAVLYGDMPLLRAETLRRLQTAQAEAGAALSLLSVMGEPDSAFGRIVRDADGDVAEIVEVANARLRPDGAAILNTRELNAGVYCFDAEWLWANIENLPLRQARSGHEYYLTDMVEMAIQQGRRVSAIVAEDRDECLGAGTRAEMVAVEQAFRRRTNARWLNAGVTLVDPASTFIDPDVEIGPDTIIWPNSFLQGRTTVGEDCVIGPNAILRDATVAAGCVVEQSVIEGVALPAGTRLPPLTYRRGKP